MAEPDVIQKLADLTTRQREVLRLFCEGLSYADIAKRLFITENTVKTHIANIYIKLGLNYLVISARRMVLHQTYCPALHEGIFPAHDQEPIEPEPAPEEVLHMVEEDEHALIPYEKKVVDIPPPIKKKRHLWKWILLLIFLVLLVIGGFQAYSWVRDLISGVTISPAQASQEQPAQVVSIPSATFKVVQPSPIPTNIISVPTSTFPPIPTRIPAPKITLPFSDNFTNGINSPWSVGYGNWFVTGSGASISISDVNDDTGSIVLDDATLTDYKVRVKVHTPHMWAASQGQFGVIVRYGSNRDQNIIFYMDSNGRFKWAYIDSLSELSFYQPAVTGVDKDAGNTDVALEIEVIGNTFIAKVNGGKIDQFSMTGFERGGIVLMTKCGNVGSCPSFSNFSIEPAN